VRSPSAKPDHEKIVAATEVNTLAAVAGGGFRRQGWRSFAGRTSERVAKAIEGQIGNRRGQRTDKQRVQKTAQVDRQMATLPKSRFR